MEEKDTGEFYAPYIPLQKAKSSDLIDVSKNSEGLFHRTDGPALRFSDGKNRYYINGKWIINRDDFKEAANITEEEMVIILLKYGNNGLTGKRFNDNF